MQEKFNILLIEDNPGDARLFQEMLSLNPSGYGFSISHYFTLSEGKKALLNNSFDLVMLDLTLPDSQGIDTLREIRKDVTEIPVIVLTGMDDEKTGIEAIQSGAQDYLIKGNIDSALLIKAIRYAIERKRLYTTLEQFAYIAAHDFKTPLINLHSQLSILDHEQAIKKEYQESIHQIKDNVYQMADSLNNLNKIISFRDTLIPEKKLVRFQDAFDKAVHNLEKNIYESAAEVSSDFSASPEIEYSPVHLQSIFYNLISNAIKFQNPLQNPAIKVSSALVDNYTTLTISDNGLGIDLKENKNKLFKLFRRFHEKIPGKGIGLHLVKSMVDSYGGKIEIESEVNKGTTLRLFLVEK